MLLNCRPSGPSAYHAEQSQDQAKQRLYDQLAGEGRGRVPKIRPPLPISVACYLF
ncbi:MAG: hypothetical protein IPL78_06350 [Chloroflexi bacterium]|nr:hypothetical protein [Chloroflexota bacterium]